MYRQFDSIGIFCLLFSEMLGEEEAKVHHPPASVIPRIHAVHVNRLQSVNPLISSTGDNMQGSCSDIIV